MPEDTSATDQLAQIIAGAGGAAAVARKLGIKYQSVQDWIARGQVPAQRVIEIEKLTGVSRHRLRPDVFGARPARLAPPRRKTQQVTA